MIEIKFLGGCGQGVVVASEILGKGFSSSGVFLKTGEIQAFERRTDQTDSNGSG